MSKKEKGLLRIGQDFFGWSRGRAGPREGLGTHDTAEFAWKCCLIDGQVNYLQHQLQRRCDYCMSEISELHHDCNNLVAV
uniref:Phorbol-ester/DAG-type domain-containing protein n=1 Tax=Romanomermis culicivorax TaxID=13658 RepID=A0A915J2N3_ROMCU